jgi:hypothetical protein
MGVRLPFLQLKYKLCTCSMTTLSRANRRLLEQIDEIIMHLAMEQMAYSYGSSGYIRLKKELDNLMEVRFGVVTFGQKPSEKQGLRIGMLFNDGKSETGVRHALW